MSFIFTHPDEDPWKGARDGLVLYFKSWKHILATSVLVVLISYGLSFILFYGSYLATLPFAIGLPLLFRDFPFIVALIITGFIKVAFIDQLTLVWMIVTYQESIKDQTPDSATMDKLEALVPKFKEITAKVGRSISSKSNTGSFAPTPLDPLTAQLVPYIQEMRSEGHQDVEIKITLIKNGWTSTVVDKALAQA